MFPKDLCILPGSNFLPFLVALPDNNLRKHEATAVVLAWPTCAESSQSAVYFVDFSPVVMVCLHCWDSTTLPQKPFLKHLQFYCWGKQLKNWILLPLFVTKTWLISNSRTVSACRNKIRTDIITSIYSCCQGPISRGVARSLGLRIQKQTPHAVWHSLANCTLVLPQHLRTLNLHVMQCVFFPAWSHSGLLSSRRSD